MKKSLIVLVIASAAGALALVSPLAETNSQPASKVATLRVQGMTCGACATAVKRVVKGLEGVKDASVSYKEKKATVTFDPSKLTAQKIAKTIEEKLPYKATVLAEH